MKLIVPRPDFVPAVKPWYFSRTLWLNILGVVAMIVTLFGVDAQEWAAIEGGILAIINLILRLRTNQGLS